MSTDDYRNELVAREERQKKYDALVTAAMNRVLDSIRSRKPDVCSHMFYGATGIGPENLVTWYVFKTDAELADAKQNGLLKVIKKETRKELAAFDYPADGVARMMVSFTTEEDIERKSPGNPWEYFK